MTGRSVVDGAFRVLRALPATGPEHQLARLAALTGLPRPTVHRLLTQLRESGAVEWADGRWALSPGLLGLTREVEPVPGLRRIGARVMQSLREQTGATVSLVVPAGTAYVALEMIPGRFGLPIEARAGAGMPAETAAGIALDPRRTPSARRRPFGAAVDDQDIFPGLTCYAVAVALPGGRRAALQIARPAVRPAHRAAAAVHHAAVALERGMLSVQRTTPGPGPDGSA
ncbi:helix-turn-helix domain-containing protein [Symbioplanes lichenis]|uniref:helix-turn-helix domain-containing protein n=1 Tax=Symbioplanes lichenis TaxID=1629072 RepID=UPI00273A33F5|nr:helix-turn-helix domain-containing protein [Actinoplanes lichenis]